MRTLTPAERRALRARAHHLSAFASVGHGGLSPSVLHEIDVSLRAHELVKIRVFAAEREARDAMLVQICEALDAAPVQHLGKVLIVWRPAPKEEVAPPPARTRSAAKRQPQARRPRSPLPRTPARPAPVAPPAPRGKGRRGAARHDPSLGRDTDLTGAPVATRRKSTLYAQDHAEVVLREAQPALGVGEEAASAARRQARRQQDVERQAPWWQPRGGKPLGFTRGAKPAGTTRGARPAATPSAAGARRRRKSP